MYTAFAFLALAALASAKPMPQGVTTPIAPSAPAPAGCQTSRSDTFQITVVNVTTSSTKRDLTRRQQAGTLTLTLSDSGLKDQAGRTGYIAANYQFQFDSPPQTGAIYTSGFSVCSNNSLALGGSAVFYQCLSGSFFNLYDRNWAPQCTPIYLVAVSGGAGSTAGASQISDGQPQATSAVTQISDGQPQASTGGGGPVTQITDGQPQAPTGNPITQISDGQPQAPTGGASVSQISDGQPQAPTPAPTPVSQISDGQPQAPTGGAPVSQISDGQPQAPTSAPPVSQISDGQPQAPTPTPAPITTSSVAIVSQISDGQPQAPTNATSTPIQFTGGSSPTTGFSILNMVAGLLGAALII